MGLFNFIYKLTNILSNKRKIKVFVIIALIILLLFWWSRGAFAVETTANPEDSASLTFYQLQLQQAWVDYMRFLKKSNLVSADSFNFLLNIINRQNVYIAPGYEQNVQFDVYTYIANRSDSPHNSVDDFTMDGYWELGFNETSSGTIYSGTRYPCKIGNFQGGHFKVYQYNTITPNPSNVQWGFSFHIPDSCFMVRSTAINELLEEFNVYNELPTTYNTNDEELQALTQAGFANQVNAINNATSAINDVNSSVEDVNESVMQMIEEITDPYVNVSQQQLPSQEVTDGTAEPLNTLFDYIKDAFTGEPTGFSLPLPFVRW